MSSAPERDRHPQVEHGRGGDRALVVELELDQEHAGEHGRGGDRAVLIAELELDRNPTAEAVDGAWWRDPVHELDGAAWPLRRSPAT